MLIFLFFLHLLCNLLYYSVSLTLLSSISPSLYLYLKHTHTLSISLYLSFYWNLSYISAFPWLLKRSRFSDFYAFQSLIRRCCEEVRNHSDLSGRDIRQSTTTQQKNNISESSVSKILLNSHIGNILQFLSKGVICIFPQKLLLYQISREPSQLLFIKSHFWFHFRFILVKIIWMLSVASFKNPSWSFMLNLFFLSFFVFIWCVLAESRVLTLNNKIVVNGRNRWFKMTQNYGIIAISRKNN